MCLGKRKKVLGMRLSNQTEFNGTEIKPKWGFSLQLEFVGFDR